MNWEAIGAIGEILGAFAVVITLLYLALQIRYAKTATNDATRLNRVSGIQNAIVAMCTDDELRTSVNKALNSAEYHVQLAQKLGIEKIDAERVEMYAVYWFWTHWGQYASSTSDKDVQELRNLIHTFYRTTYMQVCWETSPSAKPIMDPKFVDFVDSILSA